MRAQLGLFLFFLCLLAQGSSPLPSEPSLVVISRDGHHVIFSSEILNLRARTLWGLFHAQRPKKKLVLKKIEEAWNKAEAELSERPDELEQHRRIVEQSRSIVEDDDWRELYKTFYRTALDSGELHGAIEHIRLFEMFRGELAADDKFLESVMDYDWLLREFAAYLRKSPWKKVYPVTARNVAGSRMVPDNCFSQIWVHLSRSTGAMAASGLGAGIIVGGTAAWYFLERHPDNRLDMNPPPDRDQKALEDRAKELGSWARENLGD